MPRTAGLTSIWASRALVGLALTQLPGCFFLRNQAATAEYARQVMVASSRVAVLEAQSNADEPERR